MYDVEVVLTQYIETALWSSTDDADESGGEPLDTNYGPEDLSVAALATMRDDVAGFLALIEQEWPDIEEAMRGTVWQDPGQVGHDFWLTRNHHGAGFWDHYSGDQPGARLGAFLTKWAHTFGDADLYVGDDGAIHHG